MMKKALLLLAALFVAQLSFAQLNGLVKKVKETASGVVNGDVTQEEAGNGLKEALNQGVGEAVSFLSAKDGYFKSPYKILIPAEAQKVVDKLKNVPGFENLEADLTERMNRAAESAATKAKPIFVSAIQKLTFKDALNILTGNPDAATRYLERTTADPLYEEFLPVIQKSLDEVNARQLWRTAATAYNKLPFVTKTNAELDSHVTQKALVGMYSLVEKKEKAIRSDVNLRNTELLKKVFAKQDKK
ncbi:MAG TPA: DUF4197 domain-containing protein [Saprospiraceae bacterium]|nr:DUF4197 domain-containing protein [Saprospiraceae bacterium]HNG88781.1 DUF4197 domain-containing protein [Saprospiraceae bacterium]